MRYYLSAFAYPFRGGCAKFVISVLMVWVMTMAQFAPLLGPFAVLFIMGFLCCYAMKIVQMSATDDQDMCAFPDWTSPIDNIFWPLFRTLACLVICSFPLWVYHVIGAENMVLFTLAQIIAVAYFPVAYMRTAALESISGINVKPCFNVIRRAPFAYGGVVLFFIAIGSVSHLFSHLMGVDMGFGLIVTLKYGLRQMLCQVVDFYLFCVCLNVFGLFMRKHENIMGWVE